MAEIAFLRRDLTGLRAFDALGEEVLADYKVGETLKVEITRPRNLRYLKKYFALLRVLYPHQTTYPTMTKFRAAVQCALGFCESFKDAAGRTVLIPDSISFAKMDDVEFDALMQRFFDLAVTRIIPGINRDDVRRQWDEIMVGEREMA